MGFYTTVIGKAGEDFPFIFLLLQPLKYIEPLLLMSLFGVLLTSYILILIKRMRFVSFAYLTMGFLHSFPFTHLPWMAAGYLFLWLIAR